MPNLITSIFCTTTVQGVVNMQEPSRYSFRVYSFTDIPKLKSLDKLLEGTAAIGSATKLIYQIGEDSYFFIYRFGSVVFFNVPEFRQKEILDKIKIIINQATEAQASEKFYVDVRPNEKNTVGFESAILNEMSLSRLDILALILGQSTALENFEFKVDEMLRKIKDISSDLGRRGRLAQRSSTIKKFIGSCITTKANLVDTLSLLDKPDETWDNQMLDNLYREAREMFEIRDRYKTLDYKLRMTQENLKLIADLLQHKNANWLEITIIALIAVEIVFFVYELWMK